MEKSVYRQMHHIEEQHWWFVARRRIIAATLARFLPRRPLRILDAGCGTGGNLPLLARFGSVTGLEMDVDAIAFAASKSDIPVLQGSFPDALPTFPARFDVIALLDVLEHLQQDQAALRRLHDLLADDGCVILTVPALPRLWSEHDKRHHHQRRYTRRSLRALLLAAGYEIRHISYFNLWLLPLVGGVRLLKKLLPSGSLADDDSLPGAIVNRLLTAVFASEAPLVSRWSLPLGVSLLAVAVRRMPAETT